MRAAVIVPAAGSGRRLGGVRKAYLELAGEPLLVWALRPFLAHPAIEWAVVALPAEDAAEPPSWLVLLDPRVRVVAGGAERTDSVRAALAAVPPECDVVLVHDAARPLVTGDVVERVLAAVSAGTSAIAAVPVEDTVKEVEPDGGIARTLERGRLWRAQTPQAFPRALLAEAHRSALADGVVATDDAALVERLGARVIAVQGSPENFKVTGPLDLPLAEAILRRRDG